MAYTPDYNQITDWYCNFGIHHICNMKLKCIQINHLKCINANLSNWNLHSTKTKRREEKTNRRFQARVFRIFSHTHHTHRMASPDGFYIHIFVCLTFQYISTIFFFRKFLQYHSFNNGLYILFCCFFTLILWCEMDI